MVGDLFLLSERQMARISPFFLLSYGVSRVGDRRVVSGIDATHLKTHHTSSFSDWPI